MSQASTIAVNNAAGVSQSFVPVMESPDVTRYEDRTVSPFGVMPTVTVTVRRARAKSRVPVTRVFIKFAVPMPTAVGIASDGVQPPIRTQATAWANHEYILPDEMSQSSIDDIVAYVVGFYSTTEIKDAIRKRDQPRP